MRRSLAIGGSLTRADVDQLLDACTALLAQRAAIERILAELGPSFREHAAPPSTSWRGSCRALVADAQRPRSRRWR